MGVSFTFDQWDEVVDVQDRLNETTQMALKGDLTSDSVKRLERYVDLHPDMDPAISVALAMAGVEPDKPEALEFAQDNFDILIGDQLDLVRATEFQNEFRNRDQLQLTSHLLELDDEGKLRPSGGKSLPMSPVLKGGFRTLFQGMNLFYDAIVQSIPRTALQFQQNLSDGMPFGNAAADAFDKGVVLAPLEAAQGLGEQLIGRDEFGKGVNLGEGVLGGSHGSELFNFYRQQGMGYTEASNLVGISFGRPITAMEQDQKERVTYRGGAFDGQAFTPGRSVYDRAQYGPLGSFLGQQASQTTGLPKALPDDKPVGTPPWAHAPSWAPVNSTADLVSGGIDAWFRWKADPVNRWQAQRSFIKGANRQVRATSTTVDVPQVFPGSHFIPGVTRRQIDIPGVDDLRAADPDGVVSEFLQHLVNEPSVTAILRNPKFKGLHPSVASAVARSQDPDQIWRYLTRPAQEFSEEAGLIGLKPSEGGAAWLGSMRTARPWLERNSMASRLGESLSASPEGALFGPRVALQRSADQRWIELSSDIPHTRMNASDVSGTVENYTRFAQFAGVSTKDSDAIINALLDSSKNGHLNTEFLNFMVHGRGNPIRSAVAKVNALIGEAPVQGMTDAHAGVRKLTGRLEFAQDQVSLKLRDLRDILDNPPAATDEAAAAIHQVTIREAARVADEARAGFDQAADRLLTELSRSTLRQMDARTVGAIEAQLNLGRQVGTTYGDDFGRVPLISEQTREWLARNGVTNEHYQRGIMKAIADDTYDEAVTALADGDLDRFARWRQATSLTDEYEQVRTMTAALEELDEISNVYLPDFQRLRTAAAKHSKFAETMRKTAGLGLIEDLFSPSMLEMAADLYTQKVFKPLTLARLAWTVRVLGDEQLRMAAAGYDNWITSPISMFKTSMSPKAQRLRLMSLIDEKPQTAWAEFQAAMSGKENNFLQSGMNRRTKKEWTVAARGEVDDKQFFEGQVDHIESVRQNPLHRFMAEFEGDGLDPDATIAAAVEWMGSGTPEAERFLEFVASENVFGAALTNDHIARKILYPDWPNQGPGWDGPNGPPHRGPDGGINPYDPENLGPKRPDDPEPITLKSVASDDELDDAVQRDVANRSKSVNDHFSQKEREILGDERFQLWAEKIRGVEDNSMRALLNATLTDLREAALELGEEGSKLFDDAMDNLLALKIVAPDDDTMMLYLASSMAEYASILRDEALVRKTPIPDDLSDVDQVIAADDVPDDLSALDPDDPAQLAGFDDEIQMRAEIDEMEAWFAHMDTQAKWPEKAAAMQELRAQHGEAIDNVYRVVWNTARRHMPDADDVDEVMFRMIDDLANDPDQVIAMLSDPNLVDGLTSLMFEHSRDFPEVFFGRDGRLQSFLDYYQIDLPAYAQQGDAMQQHLFHYLIEDRARINILSDALERLRANNDPSDAAEIMDTLVDMALIGDLSTAELYVVADEIGMFSNKRPRGGAVESNPTWTADPAISAFISEFPKRKLRHETIYRFAGPDWPMKYQELHQHILRQLDNLGEPRALDAVVDQLLHDMTQVVAVDEFDFFGLVEHMINTEFDNVADLSAFFLDALSNGPLWPPDSPHIFYPPDAPAPATGRPTAPAPEAPKPPTPPDDYLLEQAGHEARRLYAEFAYAQMKRASGADVRPALELANGQPYFLHPLEPLDNAIERNGRGFQLSDGQIPNLETDPRFAQGMPSVEGRGFKVTNTDRHSSDVQRFIATGKIGNVDLNTQEHLGQFRTEKGKAARLLQDEYADNLPTTVRVPKPPKNVGERVDKFVDNMFRVLMGAPTNRLSRAPVFRETYEQVFFTHLNDVDGLTLEQFERVTGNMLHTKFKPDFAPTGSGAIDSLETLEDIAKVRALHTTRELLYDLSKRNAVMSGAVMRNLIPFGDAYLEVWKAWGKIIADNPQVLRQGQIAFQQARSSGFFTDDPVTGEEIFIYPGGELVASMLGLPEESDLQLKGQVQNLSMVGGVLPPFGNAVSLGASLVLPDDPSFNWLRDTLLPFGEVGVAEATLPMPQWMQKSIALATDNKVFANTQYAALKTEVLRHMAMGQPPGTRLSPELVAEADAASRRLFGIIAAAQFVAPTGPEPLFQIRVRKDIEGDAMRRNQFDDITDEQFDALVAQEDLWTQQAMASWYRAAVERTGTYQDATREFLRVFDLDPVIMTLGSTRELVRSHRTRAGVEWAQRNPDMVSKYPMSHSYIFPDDPNDPFDPYAWERQTSSGNVVARDPEVWAAVANDYLGRRYYVAAEERALAMRDNGMIDSQTMDIALTRYKDELKEHFPGYQRSPEPLDLSRFSTTVNEFMEWADEPGLQSYPAVRAMRVYLEQRDYVREVLVLERGSGRNEADLRATLANPNNRDLANYLRTVADELMIQYPEFESVYQGVLSQEVDPLR